MSVFDDLIRIGENGELIFNQWIEWDHFFIPNKPEWFREILRNVMALLGHCMECTSFGVHFNSGLNFMVKKPTIYFKYCLQ